VRLCYCDATTFIYWLEAHPTIGPQVEQIHMKMKGGRDKLCPSVFTIGEILTAAYKSGGLIEAQPIQEFFGGGKERVLLGTDAAERYAFIRASLTPRRRMRFISPTPPSLMSMFT